MTKVWGLGEPIGPLQFSEEGWRRRAIDILKPGDLVVLVATKGKEASDHEKGRLLGLMEPTKELVMWNDYMSLIRENEKHPEYETYKWPYGLLNKNAWLFPDKPLLSEISSRKFNMDSAKCLVVLQEEEANKVLALYKEKAEIEHPSIKAYARLEGEAKARKHFSPPPSTIRHGIMHLRRAPAYTYAMRIDNAKESAFKIGWAFDYEARQKQFNQVSMPAIGGLKYTIFLKEFWKTAKEAYQMEQKILKHFKKYRHFDNHEICYGVKQKEIEIAWTSAIKSI